MDSENTNCDEGIHNRFKKCEFCGKKLRPIGFDYLYVNELYADYILISTSL